MENKSHAIIAVTFLIVFSVAAAVIYMWMHRGPKEDRYYEIVSRYAVGGLQPQAPVKYKGIRVGNVKDVRFDPQDPERVLIRIGVFPDAYITHATYAQLGFQGITGITYLTLANAAGKSRTPLKTSRDRPATIPMRQGLLQAVEQTGKTDLKRISGIIDSMNDLLNADNRRHLAATMRNLDDASRQLVGLEKQLEPTLKSMPKITAEIRRLLQETREIETEMDRVTRSAGQPIKEIGDAARSVTQAGRSGDRLIQRLQEDVVPRVDTLTRRLNETITQVNRLTQQLESQPQSIIFGPSQRPPGPGEKGFEPPPAKE